jgi:hypothetical protein
MIDLLIPLGPGSCSNNDELRYCLRSICRYVIGVRDVYIVGVRPSWLRHDDFGSLHWRPWPGCPSVWNKQARIARKLCWSFEHLDLTSQVVVFNDDYVLNRAVDVRTIPTLFHGTLQEASKRGSDKVYKRALLETSERLRDMGLTDYHFDIHCPIIYRRKDFLELTNLFMDSAASPYGYVVKSLYGNSYLNREKAVEADDMKFNSNTASRDWLVSQIGSRWMFSYSDKAFTEGVGIWLAEQFPTKEDYET